MFNVRAGLDKGTCPSVFGGATESQILPSTHLSSTSKHSHTSSSKTDAAAELAARKAELQSVQEIQEQDNKLSQIRADFERMIKKENKLERLKAEKEVKIGAARFQIYEEEDEEQSISSFTSLETSSRHHSTFPDGVVQYPRDS